MSDPETPGRRPVTIIELEQPRCVHRFGAGACTATGTKCYNTPGTCGDLLNYDGSGSIKWRFMDERPGHFDYADMSDADNLECPPLPCLESVSVAENQINVGANLDGSSPLGITGRITVTCDNIPWNDAFGDHYIADRSWSVAGRSRPVVAGFWALWTARNDLFNDMFLRRYDGYEGEALADMRQSLHILEKVDGPDSSGKTTLTGVDPLRMTGEWPRTSQLDLYGDITDSDTSIIVYGDEADVSDSFGNTGTRMYLSIGTELIEYDGYTDIGNGRYALSNVVRGALGSVAADHSDEDAVQRAGRYENAKFWEVLRDILRDHEGISASFIPYSDWQNEGDRYLPTFRTTRTVIEPTDTTDLAGQLTQQGLFYIWWEGYEQEIKMLAIRPPSEDPAVIDDYSNIMTGSVLAREPDARLSQVTVYYNQIDPFEDEDSGLNYAGRFTAINGENRGETRAASIFAPWITNRTQAVQLAVRLLVRYKSVPKFLSISVDAKDRDTARVGSLLDVEVETILDTEGNLNRSRWQVISAKEIEAGHTYALRLQTFEFVGRYAYYMADGSPDYGAATDAERKTGGWYADDDGLLPDGSEGYRYQ